MRTDWSGPMVLMVLGLNLNGRKNSVNLSITGVFLVVAEFSPLNFLLFRIHVIYNNNHITMISSDYESGISEGQATLTTRFIIVAY